MVSHSKNVLLCKLFQVLTWRTAMQNMVQSTKFCLTCKAMQMLTFHVALTTCWWCVYYNLYVYFVCRNWLLVENMLTLSLQVFTAVCSAFIKFTRLDRTVALAVKHLWSVLAYYSVCHQKIIVDNQESWIWQKYVLLEINIAQTLLNTTAIYGWWCLLLKSSLSVLFMPWW